MVVTEQDLDNAIDVLMKDKATLEQKYDEHKQLVEKTDSLLDGSYKRAIDYLEKIIEELLHYQKLRKDFTEFLEIKTKEFIDKED